MALNASKVSSSPFVTQRKLTSTSHGIICSFSKSFQKNKLHPTHQGIELQQLSSKHLLTAKLAFSGESLQGIHGKPDSLRSSTLCQSTRTHKTEEKECTRPYGDSSDSSRAQLGEKEDEHQLMSGRTIHSCHALAEACRFVYNDAKFVNERARNDIILLSRGISRLDARARKGVAILGSGFLKLDARAREDTEKIDRDVKEKAERLHHIATIIKDRAQTKLKTAADKHWSDGALEADLRLADFRAKQRAMEDALMALEFVKNIHDLMVSKMYKFPLRKEEGSLTANGILGNIMLEKNGRTLDFFPGEVSTDRITAIQEAYWSMASALSEADGIDYTDPEELELLVTTLIDLDAMDGKGSASLLAECSNSPDVNTRQALANALAAAPSMWTLGNAGMGALQRLAEDKNPAIANAASKTIHELKKQWEIQEGDSWRFMMNQKPVEEVDSQEDNNDADTG
ncbi:senescence-associated protein AAF, chloroplastic isoform X1 [Populus alba]|uniref:Senescence-associated family protein n=1 Tax=Populus alba TaxID=43335 RepID=A0A4U5PVQ3_POPAL|nr:senescence-associated protein AAF, chlorolplastic [Populus alba]XP_034888446.1 senescence-associated protein AAF, chlorolplastic [Populus alba]XP_034888447.1 senescence-associated protein AAF, chlorolplastic [Populus alba]TKS00932.1 senescence-associated family protein [Populus alba]